MHRKWEWWELSGVIGEVVVVGGDDDERTGRRRANVVLVRL